LGRHIAGLILREIERVRRCAGWQRRRRKKSSPSARAAGTVDVTVVTPTGTTELSSADHYTYTAQSAPTVTGLNTSSGTTAGGTIVTMPRFDLAEFLGLVQKYRVTILPIVPPLVLALARRFSAGRSAASLLLAGDEAQTVRPTDFEWAWLNDMLHSMVGQPQEFKLTVNLRSPRRIADVVSRIWDLYGYLHKQDRPSGTGYAEIDDDGTDQIL